jgi:hypothetical protein
MNISFGQGVEWGAVSQPENERHARNPQHPLCYRLHYAALARANQLGHATVASGELSRILLKEGGVIPSAQSIANAIRLAKRRGLIDESSNARCLVLSHHQFQKGGKGPRRCQVHEDSVRTAEAA